MNTTSKVILGVLSAAAVGAVIGMLVAPEKGSDIRNKIAGNARDWAGEFADWLSARQSDLKDVKNKVGNKAEDLVKEADHEWRKAKNVLS
ncbi:MAG: YtxH domain-containing protein [Flavihumibacter sp.]